MRVQAREGDKLREVERRREKDREREQEIVDGLKPEKSTAHFQLNA